MDVNVNPGSGIQRIRYLELKWFFLKKIVGHMSISGSTDTPVS